MEKWNKMKAYDKNFCKNNEIKKKFKYSLKL